MSRRMFLKGAAASGGVAALYAAPRFHSFGPKPAYATTGFTPCLSFIDFDGGFHSGIPELSKGDRIGTYKSGPALLPGGLQPWSAFGVTVETLNRSEGGFDVNGAMIFKSSNADGTATWSGGDEDLKTPGYGTDNDTARFNILIVSENGSTSNPDDDAGGGVIVFQFDTPRILKSVDMIDIDDGNDDWRTRISPFDAVADLAGGPYGEPGTLRNTKDVQDFGENSWQNVLSAQAGVRTVRIWVRRSGG